MVYLAPEPIRELEDWFLVQLRAAFPETVYVLIGYKEDEDYEPVPYDYVKIIYTGLNNSDHSSHIEQKFTFKIVYSCHLPATLLPHRRSLALMEKGRLALWQKIPPRPSDSLPLLLKSERLAKTKECGCGPVYVQEWSAYNRVSNILVPIADPCQGANEPGAVIPNPSDYVTPLNDAYYIGVNPGFNPNEPISNGFNQPYLYGPNGWVINPDYDPNLETVWGNLPFILSLFIKTLTISVQDQKTNNNLWVNA
jgi:hypothetical protein